MMDHDDDDDVGDNMDHIDDARFNTCGHCRRSFRDLQTLLQHIKSHDTGRLFSCNICAKKFKTANGLSAHKQFHASYECGSCAKKLGLEWSEQQIRRRTHLGIKCSICGRQLVTIQQMLYKERRHHSCKFCHKTFESPVDVLMHKAYCNITMSFKCNYCTKKFKSHTALHVHKRTHHLENEAKCVICEEMISINQSTKRPFLCDVCETLRKYKEVDVGVTRVIFVTTTPT